MSRVVHFELAALQPERAVEFYKKVFGWEINQYGGPMEYWLISTGPEDQPGINGAIMRSPDGQVKTINTICVSSFEEYSEKVTSSGGKVVTPKTEIPGIGFFAYCQDTEGNTFGILEPVMPAG